MPQIQAYSLAKKGGRIVKVMVRTSSTTVFTTEPAEAIRQLNAGYQVYWKIPTTEQERINLEQIEKGLAA